MKSSEIRKSFINFFEKKGHKFIRSSSVAPNDDPTLLFTNAGMNQFKSIFLNKENPKFLRAVNSQKCIRVSGKHNDLEEVGIDLFHHTFFEMLGNWSFGDYYKEEAIKWTWELFTEIWELDKNRLWVSVYYKDEEALQIWKNSTDIEENRIVKCKEEDNFWDMGNTGPCGPCSEVHYYVGDEVDNQIADGVNNSDQYWELGNIVFIQYNRTNDKSLVDLASKHIDTGFGLERISAILQGKNSNYETDLFYPVIKEVESISNVLYADDGVSHRVIADHIRLLCFSIADGALPSNEGRGYVIRRILRRASRFGRNIGLKKPFLHKMVEQIVKMMSDFYPELKEKQKHIEKVILSEEESFGKTLDRGLNHFEKIILKGENQIIDGKDAFKLYDTFGFPIDLTVLMAKERKINVDVYGFEKLMQSQKLKARKTRRFDLNQKTLNWVTISDGSHSKFLGYERLTTKSSIRKYAFDGQSFLVLLDQTPFYAESGGQIGDTGTIKGKNIDLQVLDVKKEGEMFLHICKGNIAENIKVKCKVSKKRRNSIKRNHTATHLLHKALKIVLGEHVNQAGSLVHSNYLRFDLTHFEKIKHSEIFEIETIVNKEILRNKKLNVSVQKYEDAKKMGSEALFGEKYGDEVRVVKVGDFSNELCGGTHVNRSGDIGSFKITDESSLASGVRRIQAVTGPQSLVEMQDNALTVNKLQALLNEPKIKLIERVENLLIEKKKLEKLSKNKTIPKENDGLFNNIINFGKNSILVENVKVESKDELKTIADVALRKIKTGVGALFSNSLEKPIAVIIVTKNNISSGILAGELAKKIGAFMGGGGGGKPHMASAGGNYDESIENVMKKTRVLLKDTLKNNS